MSHVIKNGRLMQQIFAGTAYGPQEVWIDCGPAEPLTRYDRALCAMRYFEQKGRTDSKLYQMAWDAAVAR